MGDLLGKLCVFSFSEPQRMSVQVNSFDPYIFHLPLIISSVTKNDSFLALPITPSSHQHNYFFHSTLKQNAYFIGNRQTKKVSALSNVVWCVYPPH